MVVSINGVLILLFAINAKARKLTESEILKLPPLYELDDYRACLSQDDGLYCTGSLHLTPMTKPHEIYELIEEHSSDPYNFNRTFIRRGWCFSINDAKLSSIENIFEKRANQWANPRGMNARLHQLHHCRTQETKDETKPEQTLFIQVLLAILALNFVGTAYDVMTRGSSTRSKLLLAWSIPANWNKLTATYENGDPNLKSLDAVQGIRVVGLVFIIYAHVIAIQFIFFVANPEFLERVTVDVRGIFLSNGSNVVHMFLTLTSTLTTYNLLLYSEKRPLQLRMLPICIFKRIIRIAPVYALIMAYGATWYASNRIGPMSDYALKGFTETCVRKFWTHIIFVNNVVDKEESCLIPSWYLAVDMHLYILTCTLILLLWRNKQAKRFYSYLYFASLLIHFVICYVKEYESLVFMTKPEIVRKVFHKLPSFWFYYTSTWGALPSCFSGLYLGHILFDLQKNNVKFPENKWIKLLHNLNFPLLFLWVYVAGTYAYIATTRLEKTAFIIVDKVAFMCISSALFMGLVNIEGTQKRLFAWKGFAVPGRMSLCVMLCHWCVACIIAAKPYVYEISDFDLVVNWIATVVISYAVAFPVTILVEYPFQKFFDNLI